MTETTDRATRASRSRRHLLMGGGLAAMATSGALMSSRADAAPATAAWVCGGNAAITEANYLGPRNVAPLIFKTSPTNNAPAERMRIMPDGKVGIGTTAPASPLHVRAAGGTGLRSQLTSAAAANVSVLGQVVNGVGVRGTATGGGTGVDGSGVIGVKGAGSAYSVYGEGGSYGCVGLGTDYGVYGSGPIGVYGSTSSATSSGVYGSASGSGAAGTFGTNTNGPGVWGRSSQYGVFGEGNRGVYGKSTNGFGVEGYSTAGGGAGVYGTSFVGVQGNWNGGTDSQGVRGEGGGGGNTTGYAGAFNGRVFVGGTLIKAAGSFKIDHPLDPTRKYLSHSFVESPDMKNIYDGVATLDRTGSARVTLPAYFEALNSDFRYQLTCIGGHAPVYVAEKIRDNAFTIAGGEPGMEVSWQVTGTRQDAFARKHRIPVEEDKPSAERGRYLHPEAFGKSPDQAVALTRSMAAASPAVSTDGPDLPDVPTPGGGA